MLSIDQLTHVYPNGTRALESVTLEVPRGMFGLLGPNGAGKSTLMRSVATLQIPTSGRIRFDDIDVIANPGALRRTLGYLPQDFGVYPRVGPRHARSHGGAQGHHQARRAARDRRRAALAGEPLGRAPAGARRILRRHAPAVRNRARAHSATRA